MLKRGEAATVVTTILVIISTNSLTEQRTVSDNPYAETPQFQGIGANALAAENDDPITIPIGRIRNS